jgi:GAF domain-containing protein
MTDTEYNFVEETLAISSGLGDLETIMREAASAGGVSLPPFALRSLRQTQKQLEALAQGARVINNELAAYKNLARTAALINSSLELDDVLNEVMDTVVNLSGAERGYMVLVDEASGDLKFRVARNFDRESIDSEDYAVSRSIVTQVAESGEPVLTTDAASDPRFSGQSSVVGYSLRSIICVPLSVRDKVIGVVYADNKAQRGIFTQMHLGLLTAAANQAAIAITNARQFGQIKADLEEAHRQVEKLQIVIDEAKLQAQVDEVTKSGVFKVVQQEADRYRRRRAGNEPGDAEDNDEA